MVTGYQVFCYLWWLKLLSKIMFQSCIVFFSNIVLIRKHYHIWLFSMDILFMLNGQIQRECMHLSIWSILCILSIVCPCSVRGPQLSFSLLWIALDRIISVSVNHWQLWFTKVKSVYFTGSFELIDITKRSNNKLFLTFW